MSTYVETGYTIKGYGMDLHYPQITNTESDTGKEEWLQKYSR